MSKYWTLSDCYHTHSPSTYLYLSYLTNSTSTGDSQTVTTLIVQVLAFIRLLPYTLPKYWTLSDCYHTHSPRTDLYRSYHTHSPSTGDSQTVTTLIVQVLAFIRLLPYTLSKYWTLSDCYHTHSPSTDLYRMYHTHSPSTGDSQTVTTLIVQVLAFIRLLPYTLSKYWTLSDCYHTHSPSTYLYLSYHTHSPSTGDSQTVTTLIVQVLAFIRLLPYTLSKYWTLSDCYHTHSPRTDLYRSYHTHSPSTGDSQTVTMLIVQVLVILRLLPHS